MCEIRLLIFNVFKGLQKTPIILGGFSKMASEHRSIAAKKKWSDRKAWSLLPVCCCGCDTPLAISKAPDRQKLFCQGHDARLKAKLRGILRREMKREDLPAAARVNLSKIGFIQANPEFRKAFANPSQRQGRIALKGATV